MSCMAGMWNFDGKPIDRYFLDKLGASIKQYGPDEADNQGHGGPGEYVNDNLGMIYRPFHTNKESRLERQPYVTRCKDSGAVRNVMTWDGRLDNREELMKALRYELSNQNSATLIVSSTGYTDVAIVMAAWEAWGTDCFQRLIGDFSLAVWNHRERTLTLAKDFIGVRYLYYEILPEGVRGGSRRDPELGDAEPPSGPGVWWCSRLEPLILLSGRQYEINEEYIAGYFAFHPANHITPYVGVHALPAGHYVEIRLPHGSGSQVRLSSETDTGRRTWLKSRRVSKSVILPALSGAEGSEARTPSASSNTDHGSPVTLTQYWHFDPEKRITLKSDAEYEEHFRHLFFQSVKRRLRADAPVVAGLSGGRDSSAIVCVADELLAHGQAACPRLDTYSRYSPGEPFQDDHKYLTIVEQKRGRVGQHFGDEKSDSSELAARHSPLATSPKPFRPLELNCFSAHPGIDRGGAEGVQGRMEYMQTNSYRVILAGVGGDEMTGGVPNSVSELSDLLVQGRFFRLAKQLTAWAAAQKLTWRDLAWRTLKNVRPDFLRRADWEHKENWPWIEGRFMLRCVEASGQMDRLCRPPRGLPGFRAMVAGAMGVSWQFACIPKLHRHGAAENCYGRGFPFLDRDFLEFLFAIPREQILRPGQYRSLMRRALAGIVPDQILNRTRKAFAARRPALGIQAKAAEIRKLFSDPLSARLGFVDREAFLKSVDELVAGKNSLPRPIQQSITLEMWLASLGERQIVEGARMPAEVRARVLEGVA